MSLRTEDDAVADLPVAWPVRHLYAHVAFCRSRCAYCDFSSEPVGPHARAGRVEAYVARLHEELAEEGGDATAPLETVYVGGGTPTVLPDHLLLPLVRVLAGRLGPGGEFTVEVNPGTIDESRLAALAEAGVTRLSVGVQSFSPRLRRALGRRAVQAEVEGSLAAIHGAWRGDWNLDLVFGIPGQTVAEARADVGEAVAATPSHVSLYDLGYTDRYAARLDAIAGAGARASAESFAEEHYADVVGALRAAGYHRYEVSNFARPGHECRHNLAYWRGADYVGIGASAVSTVGLVRRTNPRTVAGYLAREAPEIECLTPATRLLERAMLGLRTAEGVSEKELAEVLEPAAVEDMVRRGYVRRACATLSLSPGGLDLSSAVLAAILRLPGESRST